MKKLERLLTLAICWMWGAGAAHACPCDPISPEAGFDRAQYVFAGKVARAENHAWLIEVERVWKGHERLARTVKLMDVYATLDCEFFFQAGQRYVFFAILAKGGAANFRRPNPGLNGNFSLGSFRTDLESTGLQEITVLQEVGGAPAWMKLITTFPLEHYDIPTFEPRAPPQASGARQSCYD